MYSLSQPVIYKSSVQQNPEIPEIPPLICQHGASLLLGNPSCLKYSLIAALFAFLISDQLFYLSIKRIQRQGTDNSWPAAAIKGESSGVASADDDDRRKSFPCLGGGGAEFIQDKTKEASIYPLVALTFHRNSSVGQECVSYLCSFDRLPLIIGLINGITLLLLMGFPEWVLLTMLHLLDTNYFTSQMDPPNLA